MVYKVTSVDESNPTVAFKAYNGTSTKVSVPSTVIYEGVKYKVTSISAKAFSGENNITSLTIGKYVTHIHKDAFIGCTSLKKLVIKTKLLSSKTVSKKVFTPIPASCKVYISKKVKDTYPRLLKARGLSKTIKPTLAKSF